MANRTIEKVHFRYIVCPDCTHCMCWVNPRPPAYCPECGSMIYTRIKESIVVSDENAELHLHG